MQIQPSHHAGGHVTVLVVGLTTLFVSVALAITAWEVFAPILSIALSAIL